MEVNICYTGANIFFTPAKWNVYLDAGYRSVGLYWRDGKLENMFPHVQKEKALLNSVQATLKPNMVSYFSGEIF